jgi:hypothetical protein
MSERITTYNLIGKVKVAVQEGTEKVELNEILEKDLEVYVEGDNFEARIVISPRLNPSWNDYCRIGLILKEKL